MFWLGKSIITKDGKKTGVSPIEYIIMAHLRSRERRNVDQAPVGQYGYELIKELNSLFEGSWVAKSGTIYPLLTKMDNDKDLLKAEKKKSPLGPIKKIYTLTEDGRHLIDSIIRENFDADKAFIDKYLALLNVFEPYINKKEDIVEDSSYLSDEKPRISNSKTKSKKKKPQGKESERFCPNCGENIQEISKFCIFCGAETSFTNERN